MYANLHQRMDAVLRYAAYPLLLTATLAFIWFSLSDAANPGRYYGLYLAGLVTVMVLMETLHPLRREWKMTWKTFLRRDVPFMVIGSITIGGTNYLVGIFAMHYGASHTSAVSELPAIPAAILAVYVTDFFWYWLHRLSHEMRGKFGNVLWKIHAPHHLPQQLYVFMHGVGHPINALMVRLILTIPLILLGLSPEAVFVFTVLNSFQGIVSHFNIDSRVGWMNYVVVGTELHRFHHSADPKQSKNYAAVITLWDQLFGTFRYAPGVLPSKLGVEHPEQYPESWNIPRVLALPFSGSKQ